MGCCDSKDQVVEDPAHSGLIGDRRPRPQEIRSKEVSPNRKSLGPRAPLEELYSRASPLLRHKDKLFSLGTYPIDNIFHHFTRGDVLGKGGYGEVVVVSKKEIKDMEKPLEIKEISNCETKFAMKSINQMRKDKETFPAFEVEVGVHKELESPNIVQFIASFVSQDQYHIVTELCTGGEVFDTIVNLKRFSENVASVVVRQMLLAVEQCHSKNVAHRDLKPSNFVFASREEKLSDQTVKLIDFGLAKKVEPDVAYSEKVGTPFYVSPETIDSHHPVYNHRTGRVLMACDMWAMGAIVFVIVTGKLPFPGKKHRDIFKNITKCKYKFPETLLLSDSVKDFITKLLKADPFERLTCKEALEHPWIADRDEKAPDTDITESVISGISQIQKQNRLQKAVARIAVNYLTDQDIKVLQDLFAQYDKDHNGCLEVSEVMEMLRDNGFDADAAEAEAHKMMEDLDSNHDGSLNIVEFAQTAARTRVSVSKTMARRTFEHMDSDRDGKITPFEMKEAIGDYIDDDYIEKIFRSVDTNSDGMLTFEEFLKAMTTTIRTRRAQKPKQRSSIFELNFSPESPTSAVFKSHGVVPSAVTSTVRENEDEDEDWKEGK
jgi:calcium-dependent protein kinase